jgi:hypothetical protein
LRRAISGDWTYWSISISDANLDPIRPRVERLLEQMREEQRVIAQQVLDGFGNTMGMLQRMGIAAEVAEWRRKLVECEVSYRSGTVFVYRNLVQPARDSQKHALLSATKVLDQRIASNRSSLSNAQTQQREEVAKASGRISEVEGQARAAAGRAPALSGCGCLCAAGATFLFLFSAANYYVGTKGGPAYVSAKGTAATGFIVALVLGLYPIAVLLGKIGSKLSASSIRSQVPALERERAQAESSTGARISQESARLDEELSRLKRYQQDCKSELAKLDAIAS